jgi:hypothetical protein
MARPGRSSRLSVVDGPGTSIVPVVVELFMKRSFKHLMIAAIAGVSTCVVSTTSVSSALADSSKASPAPLLRMYLDGLGQASLGVRSVPIAVVTDNGQLYQAGPASSVYPRPSLDSFTLATLSKADMEALNKLARAANLTGRLKLGVPPTADVPDFVITYRGVTNVIASLGVGDDAMPAKQLDGRKKVKALLAFLQSRPGATTATPTAVVVAPRSADGVPEDPTSAQPARPWPAAAFDLREMGGCKVLTGDEAREAVKVLNTSNELTRWTSSGYTYLVSARPALPGDRGCGPATR